MTDGQVTAVVLLSVAFIFVTVQLIRVARLQIKLLKALRELDKK